MLCTKAFEFLENKLSKFEGNYLEIGIFDGDLISSLAKRYPEKKFFGVDPFIEDGYTTSTTLVGAGESLVTQKEIALSKLDQLTNLKYYIEKSEDFYNKLTDQIYEELNVDCVLIDGSHWYWDVVTDSKIAVKLIKDKKGMIIFDDVVDVPDVSKACDAFIFNNKDIITKITDIKGEDINLYDKPQEVVIYINGGEKNA